jgi:hypothetical protein
MGTTRAVAAAAAVTGGCGSGPRLASLTTTDSTCGDATAGLVRPTAASVGGTSALGGGIWATATMLGNGSVATLVWTG